MKLISRRKCAFGNGTRPAGFEFGEFEVAENSTPYEFEKELILHRSFSKLKNGTAKVAEGVTEREFVTAYRNGHLALRIDESDRKETKPDPSNPDSASPDPPEDYSEIKIKDTGLSSSIQSALEKAGIETLGDLEDFGEANRGFTKIDGIAKAGEAAILEEFEKHIEPSPDDDEGSSDEKDSAE